MVQGEFMFLLMFLSACVLLRSLSHICLSSVYFPSQQSAKSDDGSAKSAKSEWEGIGGEWSKSAKSDGSAKSAKSEWEGIGEWSKVSLCSR